MAEELTQLFNEIRHAEDIPEEWREGIIILLPKKGCLGDCNNWRGIGARQGILQHVAKETASSYGPAIT